MTGSTSRVMKARTLLSSSRSLVLEQQLEAEEVGERGVLEAEVLEVTSWAGQLLAQEVLDHGGQLVGLGQDRPGARRGRGAAGPRGSARACIRGLADGMIGSSSPPITSVGCRSRRRNGRLVQPVIAASW